MPATTLAEINNGDAAQFVAVLGEVFENSPWLVDRAAARRPYATRDALVAKLIDIMNTAAQDANVIRSIAVLLPSHDLPTIQVVPVCLCDQDIGTRGTVSRWRRR